MILEINKTGEFFLEGIGYSVSGTCPWEPEHGVDIIVKDKELLYVGPQNCLGPWANEDEYRVIF